MTRLPTQHERKTKQRSREYEFRFGQEIPFLLSLPDRSSPKTTKQHLRLPAYQARFLQKAHNQQVEQRPPKSVFRQSSRHRNKPPSAVSATRCSGQQSMAVPIRRRKLSAGIELDSMNRRGRRASIGKGCWPQTSGLLMCDPLLWSDFRAGLPAKCQLSGRGQMLKVFSTRLFHMRPGVRAVENGSRNGMMHD